MKKLLSFQRIVFIFTLCIVLFASPSFASEANQKAIFAGGCFWCLEHDLESLEGVVSATSGYSGGDLANPTYQNHQGHQETVLVNFNSREISFEKLLRSYWRNVDPFDSKGQFCDKGFAYKPVIYYMNDEQLDYANLSVDKAAQELSVPLDKIVVEIKPAKTFWPAEKYHQDYANKNSLKYNFYRYSCGRDKRLKEIWGKNSQLNIEWENNQILDKP